MEGRTHARVNGFFQEILGKAGGKVYVNDHSRGMNGYKFPEMMTDAGPRQWTVDTYGELDLRRFIFEADGDDHDGRHFVKDTHRDRFFLKHFGLPTIRMPLSWFKGKPDPDNIIDHVRWTLAGKPTLSSWTAGRT